MAWKYRLNKPIGILNFQLKILRVNSIAGLLGADEISYGCLGKSCLPQKLPLELT